MQMNEPSSVLLVVVASATGVLLALHEQYAAVLAAGAAYGAAWLLLRSPQRTR